MDDTSSMLTIDQKMAEMRVRNLELLKRHQEIEEDRQLAEQLGAATQSTTVAIESTKSTATMGGATKHRTRPNINQQKPQEHAHERMHRPAARQAFDPSGQRIDYNRLKRERAREATQQPTNSIPPELIEYAYPFHHQSKANHDADEPAHAKKLVIVNNKVDRIGSGRFSQQQRTQEVGQRKREERMRRCGGQNNGSQGGANEFHLDMPPMPMWHNSSISPMHVQLVPTNLNGHHAAMDHLVNTSGDQMEQSGFIHSFVYSSPVAHAPFNANGTIYFAHPPPSMTTGPSPSQPAPSQTHFHQFHPTRTFENSNRQQFQHIPHFQPATVFQSSPPASLSCNPSLHSHHDDNPATDQPPRFRRFNPSDQENKTFQQRPQSGDFERLHSSQHPSSNMSSSRMHNDGRFQARPQSFYDFPSQHQANNSGNHYNAKNFSRAANNPRPPRTNMNSLPLSAYMNTDVPLDDFDNNNNWSSSYQRRRSAQPRATHQDKHQFPLSSYDPRQYGFSNVNQRRGDSNHRGNGHRRNTNNNFKNHRDLNDANDIDLIEEWWEDNNTTELIGTHQSLFNQETKPTAINDSGNSSLSTSVHLKESTLDDDDNHLSTSDFINPPSDVSTTDSNIIESLDKLQQQLTFEDAVDERLASSHHDNGESVGSESMASNKEPTTYDTAHFMQWARKKFREELAGRLTAQEIQQHDAATTDEEEENDGKEPAVPAHDEDFSLTRTVGESMDALQDDLHEKLIIDEHGTHANKTIEIQ